MKVLLNKRVILMTDILNRIKQMKGKDVFTTKEEIVADYVLQNSEEIIDLTLRELAKITETSTGTVLRLVQKDLGFSGYSEFKQKLIQELSSNAFIIDTSFRDVYSDNIYKNVISMGMNSAYKNLENIIDFKYDDKSDLMKVLYEEFLENAYNTLIFDTEVEYGGSLNKTLLGQNYLSNYVESIKEAKKRILNLKKCMIKERKRLTTILNSYKSISDRNKSEISKRTFRNNLLMVISMNDYNSRLEDVVELANNNDFATLLLYSEHTKHLMDEDYYDFSINVGKLLNYNLGEGIKEKITFYLFLEYMRIYFANERTNTST